MTFAHPQLLAVAFAIAGAAALLYLAAQRREARTALRYSSLPFLIAAARPPRWPARALAAAVTMGLALLALSAGGPRARVWTPVRGGTVVLCVDTSGSMAARDVAPQRAAAALEALRAFIAQTPGGTAVGVVSFSGQAQGLIAPTRDRDALDGALARIPAPNGATAIGDALRLAAQMLPATGRRIVVLVTDGENNAGSDPLQAARLLASRHAVLYTVGIGTNSGALIPGTLERAGIDEAALASYAAVTGGAYARARDAGELRGALAALGRTASFERTPRDVSLPVALCGAMLLAATLIVKEML